MSHSSKPHSPESDKPSPRFAGSVEEQIEQALEELNGSLGAGFSENHRECLMSDMRREYAEYGYVLPLAEWTAKMNEEENA